MSILIKGLKMPTIHEGQMIIRIEPSGKADVQWSGMVGGEYTKAVELPDHGDLIDRDSLIYELGEEDEDLSTYHTLLYAPVVIPSERSEK